MDIAIWKGKEIYITDVIKNGELELAISNASKNQELYCPNPNCDTKILQYCHGNIYTAYFRHLKVQNCEYAHQQDTPIIRMIRRKLYEHLSSKYKVLVEQKFIDNHYTPLTIINPDNSKLAIDFVYNNDIFAAKNLIENYANSNLPVNLIDISDIPDVTRIEQLSKTKRFLIEQTNQHEVISITTDSTLLKQYRLITKFSTNNENIFNSKSTSIEELVIDNNNLCLKNFNNEYQQWSDKKQTSNHTQETPSNIPHDSINNEKLRQKNDYYNFYNNTPNYSSPTNGLNDPIFQCNLCGQILSMDECIGIHIPKTGKYVTGVCRNCLSIDD